MQKKTKIVAGIVGITVFVGGGVATAHYKPFSKPQVAVSTVSAVSAAVTPTTPSTPVAQEAKAAVADNAVSTAPPPNDGNYYPNANRPAGIYIHAIIFHEGFRAPGMKAVDIHIMARSKAKENELVQGRDEIVSITGSTGKVYDMTGTKRTGVNTNADWANFQEQEITQYKDVSVNEKTITSIVVRRDGKNITIKPDADTKYTTTYPPKAATTTTATVAPKATVTATTTTPAKEKTATATMVSGIDPKYTRDKFLTDVDYKRALRIWLKRNPDGKAQLTEEDNKLLNDESIKVPAETISAEEEAKLLKKITEASQLANENMKKTPPAEISQMPQGDRQDPKYDRELAAWITAHPTVREYYKGIGNTMGQTVTDYDPDRIPCAPGYMGEWGGDYYDPAYLNALAAYYEKHPAK